MTTTELVLADCTARPDPLPVTSIVPLLIRVEGEPAVPPEIVTGTPLPLLMFRVTPEFTVPVLELVPLIV